MSTNKFFYVRAKQRDDEGYFMDNVYPCASKEAAVAVFKAAVARFKEVNKDYLENLNIVEEEASFESYDNYSDSAFWISIVEDDEMSPAAIVEELETNGFFY